MKQQYSKAYEAPLAAERPLAPTGVVCASIYDPRQSTEYYEEQSEIIL